MSLVNWRCKLINYQYIPTVGLEGPNFHKGGAVKKNSKMLVECNNTNSGAIWQGPMIALYFWLEKHTRHYTLQAKSKKLERTCPTTRKWINKVLLFLYMKTTIKNKSDLCG